jgi:S-adenosylmethionine-dependent methyltransferase
MCGQSADFQHGNPIDPMSHQDPKPPNDPKTLFQDRNFDDLSKRFTRTIYQTPKGKLRLAALRQDFDDLMLPVNRASVLDLGAGQGQFSLELARLGAKVSLCDLSEQMLNDAKSAFVSEGFSPECYQCPLQTLAEQSGLKPRSFDLVLNHAVLEWLEHPFEALAQIMEHVRPGGWLSLMFYNLHGHQWRQLMNGRTHAPASANPRLRQEGNAPQHPLNPEAVIQAIESGGFEVLRWRGIRCVHDHMHQKIRERIGENAIEKADLEFGLLDPYRSFGRYIHLLAQRRQSDR